MKTIVAAVLALSLAGCAVAPQRQDYSLIDPKGVDPARYSQDYAECAELANQTDVGERAAGSAAAGVLFGAIIGGILGGRQGAQYGAGYGAASAGSAGAASGHREQQVALRR